MYLDTDKLTDLLYIDSIRMIGIQSMGEEFINRVLRQTLQRDDIGVMDREVTDGTIEKELEEVASVRRALVDCSMVV